MTNVVYLNRSITYFDLDSDYDQVKNIFYISIQFEVKQRLNMESDVIRPIAAERIAICNLTCVLVLTSSNNTEKREIVTRLPTDIDPRQTHISLRTNLNFYKQIDQAELENLMDWRRGGDVSLEWSFHGDGLIVINQTKRYSMICFQLLTCIIRHALMLLSQSAYNQFLCLSYFIIINSL